MYKYVYVYIFAMKFLNRNIHTSAVLWKIISHIFCNKKYT